MQKQSYKIPFFGVCSPSFGMVWYMEYQSYFNEKANSVDKGSTFTSLHSYVKNTLPCYHFSNRKNNSGNTHNDSNDPNNFITFPI